ncbi:MAG: Holliday junction resolvase RuvX [Thermoleophilia bacterium]|nr:Holliday junction resolvase RuvX [Thermoleophilia bacterium]
MSVTGSDEPGRVLALDYGKARTGVAMTDPSRTIVQAGEPVLKANSSDGLATIAALVASEGVTHVVVGLPVGLRGDETKQTAQCRSFAARLAQHVDVPVELHDERFTSKLADRTRAATGSSSSRDSLAASHLLESWMEADAR